jgi:transcriptional regulator with PAS, ATPase and Fis domain
VQLDFRVVVATNQDLEEMVQAGEFREDLYWRLNVFSIVLPPLRERPGDIEPLAQHFLQGYTLSMNRKPMTLAPEALKVLKNYSWPGNVRELQNAMERAVVVGTPPVLKVEDLPARITGAPIRRGSDSLAAAEKAHIQSVLDSNDWNISRAARILEVDRGTLYNKIHLYDLERPAHAV